MNDSSELKEHAAKLMRQIDLIWIGLGIDEVSSFWSTRYGRFECGRTYRLVCFQQ